MVAWHSARDLPLHLPSHSRLTKAVNYLPIVAVCTLAPLNVPHPRPPAPPPSQLSSSHPERQTPSHSSDLTTQENNPPPRQQPNHRPRANFSCHFPLLATAGTSPASATSSTVSCTVEKARSPTVVDPPCCCCPCCCPEGTGMDTGSRRINALDVFFWRREYVLPPPEVEPGVLLGVLRRAAVGEGVSVRLAGGGGVSWGWMGGG